MKEKEREKENHWISIELYFKFRKTVTYSTVCAVILIIRINVYLFYSFHVMSFARNHQKKLVKISLNFRLYRTKSKMHGQTKDCGLTMD